MVAGHIWKCKLPLKIKFFHWHAFNNKLQVGRSLIKRWKCSGNCCVCGCAESVNHILFKCHLSKFIWNVIREVWQLRDVLKSLMEFSSDWLQGKGPLPACLLMFIFAGFASVLWTARNKMAIEKSFPKTPTDVIYLALSLMQKWSILLKEEDRRSVMQVKESLLGWLKAFRPSALVSTDVCEL